MTSTETAAPDVRPDVLPPGTIPPDGTPLGALVHLLSLNTDRGDVEPAMVSTYGHYPSGAPGTFRYSADGPVFTFVTWGDLRRIAEEMQP